MMKSLKDHLYESILDIDNDTIDKLNKRIEEMIPLYNLIQSHILSFGYSYGYGYTHYDKIMDGIKKLRKECKVEPFVNSKGKCIAEAKDLCNAIASICSMIDVSLEDSFEMRKSLIEASLNNQLSKYMPDIKCNIEWGAKARPIQSWNRDIKSISKKSRGCRLNFIGRTFELHIDVDETSLLFTEIKK